MTRRKGTGRVGLLSLWLLTSTAPALGNEHGFQISILPAVTLSPDYVLYAPLSPSGDANSFAQDSQTQNLVTDRFRRLGASAALQLSYEALVRDAFSGFLWLQGGLVGKSVIAPTDLAATAPDSPQSSVQQTLLSYSVLFGATFRLNIDRLAFADRSSRLGALFELGIGLAGAHLAAPTQALAGPGNSQVDLALVDGKLSLGLHLGVGLDYWVTRRFIIGVTLAWDVPAISNPTMSLLRAADGSVLGLREELGYLSIGPRLALRL